MLLSRAGCLVTGFILFISGVQGRANIICALKGSSVDLSCSAQRPTSNMTWYTVQWDADKYVLAEISADRNPVRYNMSAERNFTLTISNLTEEDENYFCCGYMTENPGRCWYNKIQLRVADLQVKVLPTTDEHTVTLICSTSCPLTENPAVYIWYKNREFLYQDWSPWYQELVSSEEAVTYSCAIEGYEDVRAPEVSVDSVSSTCFNVTYAKGRMCSYQQTSEDEPCSITYPTELYMQVTPLDEEYNRLTCTPSCPQTDPHTAYRWYKEKRLYKYTESQNITIHRGSDDFSCAVKGHEHLRTDQICLYYTCASVNYFSRGICALEGSSVNISSEYSQSRSFKGKFKLWYKEEELVENAGPRVTYEDNIKDQHILRINNLTKDDSAEYTFTLQVKDGGWKRTDSPGVTLVVTGLKVQFRPSENVTEDQRVTLTCSTSCPLTDNYIWFFNSRPLTLTGNQSKHLVLDPVSSQDAGHYSCAVKTHSDNIIRSQEETLTVQSHRKSMAVVNAVRLAAVLLIPAPLLLFHLWFRSKQW